mmetsp:Transcript_25401/g.73103  ORF Transcript_25401/g.73103 Transcript_25401/m.73103 type:complete len:440 (-) Transcript_25401:2205-3524(-)
MSGPCKGSPANGRLARRCINARPPQPPVATGGEPPRIRRGAASAARGHLRAERRRCLGHSRRCRPPLAEAVLVRALLPIPVLALLAAVVALLFLRRLVLIPACPGVEAALGVPPPRRPQNGALLGAGLEDADHTEDYHGEHDGDARDAHLRPLVHPHNADDAEEDRDRGNEAEARDCHAIVNLGLRLVDARHDRRQRHRSARSGDDAEADPNHQQGADARQPSEPVGAAGAPQQDLLLGDYAGLDVVKLESGAEAALLQDVLPHRSADIPCQHREGLVLQVSTHHRHAHGADLRGRRRVERQVSGDDRGVDGRPERHCGARRRCCCRRHGCRGHCPCSRRQRCGGRRRLRRRRLRRCCPRGSEGGRQRCGCQCLPWQGCSRRARSRRGRDSFRRGRSGRGRSGWSRSGSGRCGRRCAAERDRRGCRGLRYCSRCQCRSG